jgi:glycosyltransferase involved in cell wall biosynthesis
MKASVIIPTTSPDLVRLRICLDSLVGQCDEIIVVENPVITDRLSAFLSLYANVKHISSEQGANNARNAGAKLATGKVLVFVDDDVVASDGFVDAHVACHHLYKPGVVGGPVELLFEHHRPTWLTDDKAGYLARVEFLSDNGMAYEVFKQWELHVPIVSANMSFDKQKFWEFGGFDSEQGYIGREILAANDELTIISRASKCTPGIIMANCPVQHIIPSERATADYLIRRAYGQGVADFRSVKLMHRHMTTMQAFEYMLLNFAPLFEVNASDSYLEYEKMDRASRIFASAVHVRVRLSYIQGVMSQTHD